MPRRAEVQPCLEPVVRGVRETGVMWKKQIHCVKQPGKPKENLLCEILRQNGDSVLGCSSSADSISRSPDCNFMLPITAVELIT